MSYFKNFPYVDYPFPDNIRRQFKNISLRPALHDDVYEEGQSLETYIIQDGETPETIAWDRYGEVNMHWIIMLCNNIINLYTDWPKSTPAFQDYIYYKYRNQLDDNDSDMRQLSRAETLEFTQYVGTPEDLHQSKITRFDDPNFSVTIHPPYFENIEGELISYDSAFVDRDVFGNYIVEEEVTPLSYYEWEVRLNEKKREIWIPTTNMARRMQKQLKELLNE